MGARYHCPITACRWFHDTVATDLPPDTPADLVYWPAGTWGFTFNRTRWALATMHVVDAHLVTHSPVEWMTEMARLKGRIKSVEQLCGDLTAAVQNAANFTEAMHAVTTMRLPSRAEVESIQEQLAGLVGTGGRDA